MASEVIAPCALRSECSHQEAASTARTFLVDLSDSNCQKTCAPPARGNLQEAFMKFRKQRQTDLNRTRMMKKREVSLKKEDATRMKALRAKFLETAKSYFGVPYARRYHEPGTPMYNSPLFLDCCGLVRRVMKDLKEDFGFSLGPWNQAYMFDLLPIELSGPEEMQPGDLVFVTATYNNPKVKQQRHHVVHVEIWAGEEEKTIGARWGKSCVELHDHYTYVSKSYHGMKYHFRSINTWLQGICKSYCSEHRWQISRYEPSKHSIFYTPNEEGNEEEAADPTTDDDTCSASTEEMSNPELAIPSAQRVALGNLQPAVRCCPADSSPAAEASPPVGDTVSGET